MKTDNELLGSNLAVWAKAKLGSSFEAIATSPNITDALEIDVLKEPMALEKLYSKFKVDIFEILEFTRARECADDNTFLFLFADGLPAGYELKTEANLYTALVLTALYIVARVDQNQVVGGIDPADPGEDKTMQADVKIGEEGVEVSSVKGYEAPKLNKLDPEDVPNDLPWEDANGNPVPKEEEGVD